MKSSARDDLATGRGIRPRSDRNAAQPRVSIVARSIRGVPETVHRLGIGAATELFGLTHRAMRFYEARGLVTAHRDRLNQRCYDQTGRIRLAWISELRQMGLSLDEIEPVLEALDEGLGPAAAAREARRRLSSRCRELEAALQRVRDFMSVLEAEEVAP